MSAPSDLEKHSSDISTPTTTDPTKPNPDHEILPSSVSTSSSSQNSTHEPNPDNGDLPTDPSAAALTTTKSLGKDVSLLREILVVGTITLAQFMTQAALSQMLSILHIVGADFGIENPGVLSWLIAGYSLTVGTFILISGRLGDLFGWKKMFVIGFAWFGLWSVISGLAVYSNSVLFIFTRVLAGIGPAICLPNGLALLGGLYEPGMRKNMAFAVFGASAPGGAIVGAVFASLFTFAWWPWAFWSFGIALVIIAIVAAFVIPDPQIVKPGLRGKTLIAKLNDMDLFGATVGITGLILFNFAWNQAPIAGWDKAYIIVTLILGVVLIAGFFWVELKFSTHPLIPFDVFTSDNAFVLGCISAGWATFGIMYFYLWQILEELQGNSPLLSTAKVSPVAITGAIAAVGTGILLGLLRPAWLMVIAMCAFLTGTILVATVPVHQTYWAQIFVCVLVVTFGMDMSFPAGTIMLSNSVAKEHQGVAASLVNTIVNYSISLGLGFAGTVEVHVNNGGQTPSDVLKGYRGALYLGVGLSGLGLGLAILFLLKGFWEDRRKEQKREINEKPNESV